MNIAPPFKAVIKNKNLALATHMNLCMAKAHSFLIYSSR